MTEKQRIMFYERKKRYLRAAAGNLQFIAKNQHIRESVFDDLRANITELEALHTPLGKEWLTKRDKFLKYYDLDEFLESENPCTKEHLLKVIRGDRAWSPRLKECIINYMKKVTV